jgi:hypothetical protein
MVLYELRILGIEPLDEIDGFSVAADPMGIVQPHHLELVLLPARSGTEKDGLAFVTHRCSPSELNRQLKGSGYKVVHMVSRPPCLHLKDDTSEADWLLRREVANEDDVTDCRAPGGQYAGDDEQRVHEWPSLLVRSRCQYPTSRKNRPQLIGFG